MKSLVQHFRLRSTLFAFAALSAIALCSPLSAAELPQSPQTSTTFPAFSQGFPSTGSVSPLQSVAKQPLLPEMEKALKLAALRAKEESEYIALDDWPLSSGESRTVALAGRSEGAPIERTNADTSPQGLTDKARALAPHIADKFRVNPSQASSIVANAFHYAELHGLPPTLLLAVIAVESSFNPTARNGNARGLMQIIPFWHKEKVHSIGGPEQLMNVEKNIATGSKILKEYISQKGSIFKGLRQYNASAAARQYSEKVLEQKSDFEKASIAEP